MGIVLANDHKPTLLRLKLPYLTKATLRLFQNNWTPLGTDSVDSFVEADFAGYAPVTPVPFGGAYLNLDGQGEADTCPITWKCQGPTTPNTIYGYYATDTSDKLVWSDRNSSGPVKMQQYGDTYTLVIQFMEDTLYLLCPSPRSGA